MERIKTDKATLRKFGLTMAASFAVLALLISLKKGHIVVIVPEISLVFLAASLIFPPLLRYVYVFWMKLAFLLGWLNTRLLLCVIFYAVFAPAGVLMRLFGIDLLERKLDKNSGSYWKPKEGEPAAAAGYERQF